MVYAHFMLDTKGHKYTHTHTHSGCVIFIAFPPQQWLHEHTSLLRYTYIARLVYLYFEMKEDFAEKIEKNGLGLVCLIFFLNYVNNMFDRLPP